MIFRRALVAWQIGMVLATGCAHADAPVHLAIINAGEKALRCTLMFGHWVTRAIGPIAPGATNEIAFMRMRPNGALYVARTEDGRRMMIESIICGTDDQGWAETLGQIPLTALRGTDATGFRADCARRERIACTTRRADP